MKYIAKNLGKTVAVAGLTAMVALACTACSGTSATSDSSKSSDSSQTAATEQTSTVRAVSENVTGKETKGTVTTTVDMSQYDQGKVVRVWLPVAQDGDYQKVTDVAYDAPKATKSEITNDSEGNKMLYLEWDANVAPADRTATLSFKAERQEVRVSNPTDDGSAIPDDVKQYLEGSSLVPVNDQVKAAADEITSGKTGSVEKARAIYDWIIENMNRDESVKGCGTGDVCALLSTKSGKCTDINSVFVGLCRAAGIPAREMFGVRMNAEDITKNQHCWCEFYVAGTGWVPADPADVLKAVLKGGWTKDQTETKEKAEYYWGGWDCERIELSEGRDLTLSPAQSDGKLNNFGYPYAEVDGSAVDYYDPTTFVYTISFTADK
jgi:transglutaminase-like putative cysteine protease